jgi:hypothetical protein
MTEPRPGTLGEIAMEAGQERAAFLNDAASQLRRFLEANRDRIAEVGGLVLLDEAGVSPDAAVGVGIGGSDPYIGAADDWAAAQDEEPPSDTTEAARRLYDLALTFQSRSQLSEARLVEQFELAAAPLASALGDLLILDDEDERVWFKTQGSFEAEVIPEPEDGEEPDSTWKPLGSPEDLVQYYDPTDLFGNLAETLAEQFPSVDPEFDGDDDGETEGHDEA